MSTALTTQTSVNALAAYGQVDPYAAAASDMGSTGGDVSYLKFDGNVGTYTKGSGGGTPVATGTRLIVNPQETQRGWIAWNNGQRLDEILVRIEDGRPPLQTELPNRGPFAPNPPGEQAKNGWFEQVSVRMADMETGETIVFKTSTQSAMIAVANFLANYGRERGKNPGLYPVVELGSRSFTPKGKTFKKYAPEFRIVEWVAPEQLVVGDSEEYYDEEPGSYEAPEAAQPEPAPAAPPAPPARPAPAGRPTPPALANRPAGPRPRSF